MLKKISILFIVCCTVSGSILAQSSFIKWISTEKDEQLTNLEYLESNGTFFYSYYRGDYGNGIYDIYFDYSKYYIKADQNLTTIDSIVLNTKDSYLLSPLRFLTESPEGIILFCTALDTITFDKQLYIVWLDSDLNIVEDHLYGLPDREDDMTGFCLNHNNNILFFRNYPISKDINNQLITILWEIDLQGNEIAYKIDTIPSGAVVFGISDMTGIDSYQCFAQNSITYFNYNLEYDTTIFYYEEKFLPYSIKKIDSTISFILGIYNSNMPPFYYEDFDLGFMLMDDEANHFNLQIKGSLDTNEISTRMDYISLDTLFVGGTKQVHPGPNDTWVTIYKTNMDGDNFFYKHFGGYGRYDLNYLLATPDGGCIAGCSFWDFYENPSYHTHDIVILKFNSNGDLITTVHENTPPIIISDFIVYPNPGNNVLNISSAKDGLIVSLFDLAGKLVLEKRFNKSISINTDQLPKGIYSYKIFQKEVQLESGKWMKD